MWLCVLRYVTFVTSKKISCLNDQAYSCLIHFCVCIYLSETISRPLIGQKPCDVTPTKIPSWSFLNGLLIHVVKELNVEEAVARKGRASLPVKAGISHFFFFFSLFLFRI